MATTAEISKVRRRIGDRVKNAVDVATGNGTDRVFNLRFNNVFDEVIKINNVEQTTGYTVNGSAGSVTFDTAPGDVEVEMSYNYAAYTDTEIGGLIDSEGVGGAVMECLKELLADTARFYDYTEGQTTARKSQVFDHLKELLKTYNAENDTFVATDGSSLGGLTIGTRTHRLDRKPSATTIDLTKEDEDIL